MSIDNLIETELDGKQREALFRSSAIWKSQAEGRHLDDWLDHIPSLRDIRTIATRIAGNLNKTTGRRYSEAFGALRDRFYPGMDSASVTALLWLGDDPERISTLRRIRETISPGERARLNSPITAVQRVKKELNPKQEDKTDGGAKTTAKEELAKALEEVHRLKQELARAENDGSVLDLKLGPLSGPASIGRIIADTISESRWKMIVKDTNAHFAKKKAVPVAA